MKKAENDELNMTKFSRTRPKSFKLERFEMEAKDLAQNVISVTDYLSSESHYNPQHINKKDGWNITY